jgi:hypothetical protein
MNLTGVVQRLRKERDRAQLNLQRLDAALSALDGLNSSFKDVRVGRRGHKPMSAAARRRMSAAQRARWAKVKARRTGSKGLIPIRAKHRLSAARLASIRAAQRARWAKQKRQKAA